MQCASTHRRPIDSAPIAPSASLSSRPNSPAWPIRTRADTASAYARYRRFLKETKHGLAIDRQGIAELERFDGKFVVHSNDDTLTAEDMALGYKQQQRVEEAWRTMKGGLRMRPMFNWAPHRIHAHIAITVLALLLERVIEHACQDTWRNIRDDLRRIQLAQLSSPNGTVWQITEPTT
ncbi:IS1634 family transposase [Thauera aminoaromatica]|nr:transposase [Thauera aminoaromatica]